MIQLNLSLASWGSEHFKKAFIEEVSSLSLTQLPLQQAMSMGNVASKHNLEILLLKQYETSALICIHTGIFYSSIVSGCNCADDPTPIDYNTEYCELEFKIDKKSAQTDIRIREVE